MKIKIKLWMVVLLISMGLLSGCGEEKVVSIGVNALVADPIAYQGQINVVGIVQNQDIANRTIVIIDEAEYETCGLNPCGSAGKIPIYLPTADEKPYGETPSKITYEGDLPKVEEKITLTGAVTQGPSGYVFEATEIRQGSKVILKKN